MCYVSVINESQGSLMGTHLSLQRACHQANLVPRRKLVTGARPSCCHVSAGGSSFTKLQFTLCTFMLTGLLLCSYTRRVLRIIFSTMYIMYLACHCECAWICVKDCLSVYLSIDRSVFRKRGFVGEEA